MNSPAYAFTRLQESPWWEWSSAAAKESYVKPNGLMRNDFLNMLKTDLIDPYMELASRHLQDEHALLMAQADLLSLRHWSPMVAQFELNGSLHFDCSEEKVTSVDLTKGLNLKDFKSPGHAFFLHYGLCDEAKLPFEDLYEYLDGVFVATTPFDTQGNRLFKFFFTTSLAEDEGRITPGHVVDLHPSEQQMALDLALSMFLDRKRKEHESQPAMTRSDALLSQVRMGRYEEGAELMRLAWPRISSSLQALSEKSP